MQFMRTKPEVIKPINRLLVANRGEIAVRVIRACKELNIKSIAIYPKEDENCVHRIKADEAYKIGKGKKPVEAYLDIPGIIAAAKEYGADAIHPGYGFLSESGDFSKACRDAGIVFVGPSPEVLYRMANKVHARKSALDANVPVVPGTKEPLKHIDEAHSFVKKYGLPVIFKAARGGGGRGMRMVKDAKEIEEGFIRASSEAKAAVGDGSVFVERYLVNPRHIEVQIMGDSYGNAVHFFDRDCSVQRRHQKVIEIAPSPNLKESIRNAIYNDAVNIVKSVGYSNAGTVEFLVDHDGSHYFMEVNCRLQVEHTVSEEITGVDLCQTQIKVAEGHSLPSLGLSQDKIKCIGSAIQCRLTTEDPSKDFKPDAGVITGFERGEGFGVRIDASTAYTRARVSPFFDSLLCKIITRANDFDGAIERMLRVIREFEVDGVKTNSPFLINVLENLEFRKGGINTGFIEQYPDLLKVDQQGNDSNKLLNYLAEVMINGSLTPLGTSLKPAKITPEIPDCPQAHAKPPRGWKQVLQEKGPEGFAKAVRAHPRPLLMDTTFRDAHQSLLATRVRTYDLLRISPFVASTFPEFFSMENWGGATFDVSMRFLHECPWERAREMRKRIPNIPFQMLLRGSSAVGYKNYPDNAVYKFCELAVKNEVDVFRIFDSLNYLPNMVIGMEAVGKAGGVIEGSICYTGDVSDPNKRKYNLDYYVNFANDLVKAGTHILAVKDMAGLLRPQATEMLVDALRQKFPDVPIHMHTHDTAGTGVANWIAAIKSGADVVDVAVDSMSGLTSQPSMGALVSSFTNTKYDIGLKLSDINRYSAYWEQTRTLYGPFEATVSMRSGNSDVYVNEIPGGQYTNLQFQAFSLGLGSQFEEVKQKYAEANALLGDIVKVTPSSKVVGDLAQFMVQNNLCADDVIKQAAELSLPESVIEFFQGALGDPYQGYPEPLRSIVVKDRTIFKERPGSILPPINFKEEMSKLKNKFGSSITEEDLMSSIMFPAVTDEFLTFRQRYGPVDKLETRTFFIGPDMESTVVAELREGKKLIIKPVAIGKLSDTNEKEVFFELNGNVKPIRIKDKKSKSSKVIHPKAIKSNEGSIGAPMPGTVVDIKVKEGQDVKKGDSLVVLSAMKMETVVKSPVSGKVVKLHVTKGQGLEGDDLLVEIKV
ncbi:hypothetical protein GJ496_010381 [Pomphorhynchus laevis]|nr:hypothetical protein GJ496_010381 [Pomphorhynchus laevis]